MYYPKSKKLNMRKMKLKAPELMRARNALIKFLRDNDLDPAKDYSKHLKYGEEYRKLMLTLQIERDKVMLEYPNQDIKNRKKYYKMRKDKKDKKKAAKAAAVAEAPAKVTKKVAKASKEEKKATAPRASKYDYPLIDGREMTSAEKKKYRTEQRKAASGNAPKEKKEKKAKKAVTPEAEAPKEKKSKKEKKALKIGKKDKKKAKKDED